GHRHRTGRFVGILERCVTSHSDAKWLKVQAIVQCDHVRDTAPPCGVGSGNRYALARVRTLSDVPIAHRGPMRSEAEQGLEGNVPVETAVVSEGKLVEAGVDVLAPQAVIGAEPPSLQQRKDARYPEHYGDRGASTSQPVKSATPTLKSINVQPHSSATLSTAS